MGDFFNILDLALSSHSEGVLSVAQFVSFLESLVFRNRNREIFRKIDKEACFQEMALRTRAIYGQYEVALESEAYRAIEKSSSELSLHDSIQKLGFAPIARTLEFARLEAESLSCDTVKRCCHIGHGAFPETLFALRKFLAQKDELVGLDFDKTAHMMATNLVKQYKIDRIDIVNEYGEKMNYADFCHIHIAVLVRPLMLILKRIFETADQNTVLVLRNVDGLASLIYEPISEKEYGILAENQFVAQDMVRGHAVVHSEIFVRRM